MISSAFVILDFIWARDPVTLQIVLTYNFGDMFFLTFGARPLCRPILIVNCPLSNVSFHCFASFLVLYLL